MKWLPIVLALIVSPGPARAQELRIALKAAVDSADPAQLYTPNRNVHLQVYEPLIQQDDQSHLLPGLALSWRIVDPLTWELKLAEAQFSDGTAFGAEDVMFTIRRIQVSEGTRTYRIYTRDIAAMEAPDAHTLLIHTSTPAAGLPVNLTAFGIVSARAAKDATAEDFNGGRAAVGTGPYRWVRYLPGQSVSLARNERYRGGAVPWATVEYRFVPNDSARVAALLAGDVDVIDTVPPNLFERVRGDARTRARLPARPSRGASAPGAWPAPPPVRRPARASSPRPGPRCGSAVRSRGSATWSAHRSVRWRTRERPPSNSPTRSARSGDGPVRPPTYRCSARRG